MIDTQTDLNAACLLKDGFKPSPTDFLTAKSSANWQNASRLHSSCSWLSPQVHTFLKGLEKIAASADIPMLVCGDFNSVPGRYFCSLLCGASHALLAMGKIDPMHPDLVVDPLGILRPHSKLAYQLPLVSASSSLARVGVGLCLEQKRRRMDPSTNEPLFMDCTRDFIGTLDYLFCTAGSLAVESLLELLDEDGLRKDIALPSPEWSSDHISLLTEFHYMPRLRR
ncbi:hypothetical protein SLEP1_g49362 [Rubroshorea leprosula]|uniref:Endonuclease/exonuclease/phosphatase domain-containing protein n=1 Tax=Rubroshorea leprosula TaxID=152421 RepID=A0AAV5LWM4_9ROSI|nr:hypothetical protein SLEP1_g49362 [Rubroshorea leprosula]